MGWQRAAHAEIEPVILQLFETTQASAIGVRYDIPDGKTLIIEHVSFEPNYAASSEDRIFEIWNGNRNLYRLRSFSDRITFTRPLRIPDSRTFNVRNGNSPSVSFGMNVFGLLVDNEDLYAGDPKAEIELASADSSTGEVQGSVKLSTARPMKVRLQSSVDLENWNPATGIVVTGSSGDPKEQIFAGFAPGAPDRYFLRAVTFSRSDILGLDF